MHQRHQSEQEEELSFSQGLFNTASDSGLFRTSSDLTDIAATFDGWTWTKGDRRNAAETFRTGGLLSFVETDVADTRREPFAGGGAKVR